MPNKFDKKLKCSISLWSRCTAFIKWASFGYDRQIIRCQETEREENNKKTQKLIGFLKILYKMQRPNKLETFCIDSILKSSDVRFQAFN